MTNLNHAATGALVAVAIHNPWLGLPAAFGSHFIIDALPHWDFFSQNFRLKQVALAVDMILALFLLIILAVTVDMPSWLIIAGGLLGIAADFMWAPYLITGAPSKINKKTLLHWARRFHFWVQLKEFPEGIYIETGWLTLMVGLIYQIHR